MRLNQIRINGNIINKINSILVNERIRQVIRHNKILTQGYPPPTQAHQTGLPVLLARTRH